MKGGIRADGELLKVVRLPFHGRKREAQRFDGRDRLPHGLCRHSRPPRQECATACGRQQPRIRCIATISEDNASNWGKQCMSRSQASNVAVIGNICIDIIVQVDSLPPSDKAQRIGYMQQLFSQGVDESMWEVGGNANFAIMASRLGIDTHYLGHYGEDVYGSFLERVLKEEGVGLYRMDEDISDIQCSPDSGRIPNTALSHKLSSGGMRGGWGQTLLCWVLVDPQGNHSFCSRFDFNRRALYEELVRFPKDLENQISESDALMFNGFVFDEFNPDCVESTISAAHTNHLQVFFDPGPRTARLLRKTPDVFRRLVNMSTVLLMTDDEAAAMTGLRDPHQASVALSAELRNNSKPRVGQPQRWVIVKVGPKGCIATSPDDPAVLIVQPGIKVDHICDTVACGDSFAAGIMLGYLRGASIEATTLLANAVGAGTAMGIGGGRNVSKIDQIVELLKTEIGRDRPTDLIEESLSLVQ